MLGVIKDGYSTGDGDPGPLSQVQLLKKQLSRETLATLTLNQGAATGAGGGGGGSAGGATGGGGETPPGYLAPGVIGLTPWYRTWWGILGIAAGAFGAYKLATRK